MAFCNGPVGLLPHFSGKSHFAVRLCSGSLLLNFSWEITLKIIQQRRENCKYIFTKYHKKLQPHFVVA